ncbi:polysaccharide deacetylase family protein [Paenibacillus filicis]|uniref:Polysaccharide deacetylase family protein n=1 Tax=Paenibacillus gyeongsangnamensis TaxID=3388067 RepID=A0ABT4Q6L3_9BACL|nr:polysaccharide deacetylase [Paenibacillus filicis]MCZ8512514.1 polysaccharide deacetylase family protein [Paenibacillus filicis]
MTYRHNNDSTQRGIAIRIWLLVLLLLFPAGLIQGIAKADGETEAEAAYNQLKAGKRVDSGKSYVKPEQPTVYLTFDDGPSKLTPKVLDILKEEGVKATFFVLGNQVEAYPRTAERIVKEGHAIGNHSYNHVYEQLYSGFGNFWSQIRKTDGIISETTGIAPRLIRAPGGTAGNFDSFYFYYLEQAGYEVVDWNVDSGDATRPGVKAQEIIRAIQNTPYRWEHIVLMHDGTGHDESVKALPEVIRWFKEKGYAFASLSTEVKPVQFSVGKSKWGRSVSWSAFTSQWDASLEREDEWGDKLVAEEAVEAPKTAVAAAEPPGPERLEIELGERKLLLSRDGYVFRNGYFSLPLRQLTEAMGGTVDWDGEKRTAIVRYGITRVDYDLSRLTLRVYRGADPANPAAQPAATVSLPEMELRNGVLYVPLRRSLELTGGSILSYEAPGADGTARIATTLHGGFSWAGGLIPLRREGV